jgi:NADH-quinone oxidoreductase subunit J
MDAQAILFYLLGGLAVLSALLVILQRNPVHSAVYLVVTFLSMAGLYVTLEAEFIAAVQVLVYAGGIVVLFLFVIMLVQLEQLQIRKFSRIQLTLMTVLVALLVASFLSIFTTAAPAAAAGDTDAAFRSAGGNLQAIGDMLYRDYLLPFEIASVLLLAAMIGAVILARARN